MCRSFYCHIPCKILAILIISGRCLYTTMHMYNCTTAVIAEPKKLYWPKQIMSSSIYLCHALRTETTLLQDFIAISSILQ